MASATARLAQDRSRDKQRMLVDAALELWSERGFEATTVSELCERAGVSKGSFYFYFRSKEDLLLELGLRLTHAVFDDSFEASLIGLPIDGVLERVIVALSNGLAPVPRDLVARYLVEAHRHLLDWPEVRGERRDVTSVLSPIFGRAIRRGEVRPGFGPAELGHVLASSMTNAILAWAQEQDGGLGLEELLRRRVNLMLHGALAPQSLASS